ncbi:MAG: PilC/PilY family type IV pilus protein [Gammaproteobacteria bacterium]|nr:PilC/PilY family type IV pilus protein [Gammaproteobacteria bacterium]
MNTLMRVLQVWLAFMGLAAWTCSSQADELGLVSSPLFLGTSIDANIFFEVDDSGSMDWETLTNEYEYYTNYWADNNVTTITSGMWRTFASAGGSNTGRRDYGYMFAEADRLYQNSRWFGTNSEQNPQSYQRDWRGRSSDFNLVYYDPTVTYEPWIGYANATFTAARSDPALGSDGYTDTRNLTGFVFEVWEDDHGYVGTKPGGPTDATDTPNGEIDLWDSHVNYTVNTTTVSVVELDIPVAATMATLGTNCNLTGAQTAVPYEDCFGTVATSSTLISTDINPWGRNVTLEQQNIANWYSYYRKRSYVAKAAIAAVIDEADDFRYGLSLLNDDDDVFVEVPAAAVSDYTTHNAALLNELFTYDWQAQGTPLRRGLENVGEYFDDELSGKTDPIVSQCQQNFSILLTDGFWGGSAPASGIGDADGDGRSITLADVAKYYYDKDLSPLANSVPTSVIDGNNEQHMVTFGVAFGVSGDLVDSDDDGIPNPVLAEDDTWGDNPSRSNPGKIDDLWHAAFNSKGDFVAAQTPSDLVDSLTDALSEISDRVGSSASVATNSGSLNAGSHLFQARFDSGGWSGQLIAFALNADGSINPNPSWEASEELDTQNFSTGRNLITFNPDIDSVVGGGIEGEGVAFRFPADYKTPSSTTDISAAQIDYLLTNALFASTTTDAGEIASNQAYGAGFLNYLRGDRSNEDSGYNFRDRNSALGDIVDSDPQFVGVPRFPYPDSLEASTYSSFATAHASRPSMVYVGANDGMMHGFDESTGAEVFAYIPNLVFEDLPELGQSSYIHRYFVNEPPTVVDAFFPNFAGSGEWRTALVGGLGLGGQGMYALDVTDPSTLIESNADDISLWEFNDADDPDLGYSFGSPSIAKMHNGQWVAVFGNGYNNTEADGAASTTGHASLFIVDIETGDLVTKIDTGVGSVATPNGLASPALVDIDRDFLVDYIYAGDIEGNVWKFDVTDSDEDEWDVAYKSGSTPLPLFSAPAGQQITTRPQITLHPADLDGFMVYFGTGQYLETGDNDPVGADTQAFYGVWDKNETTLTAFDTDDLLQQFITDEFLKGFDTDEDTIDDRFFTLREVSDYPINYDSHMGWYMQLLAQLVEGSANTDNFGEKQVSNALVRDGRVIFTTLIPSQNQCDFGGSSFIMELDFLNGGQLSIPPFDLSGDGEFDSDDQFIGGSKSDVGIVPTLSIISDGDSETAFGSGSSGDIEAIGLNVGSNALGRQSWRQLQ